MANNYHKHLTHHLTHHPNHNHHPKRRPRGGPIFTVTTDGVMHDNCGCDDVTESCGFKVFLKGFRKKNLDLSASEATKAAECVYRDFEECRKNQYRCRGCCPNARASVSESCGFQEFFKFYRKANCDIPKAEAREKAKCFYEEMNEKCKKKFRKMGCCEDLQKSCGFQAYFKKFQAKQCELSQSEALKVALCKYKKLCDDKKEKYRIMAQCECQKDNYDTLFLADCQNAEGEEHHSSYFEFPGLEAAEADGNGHDMDISTLLQDGDILKEILNTERGSLGSMQEKFSHVIRHLSLAHPELSKCSILAKSRCIFKEIAAREQNH